MLSLYGLKYLFFMARSKLFYYRQSLITLDNAESKILSPVVDIVTEIETQKYR